MTLSDDAKVVSGAVGLGFGTLNAVLLELFQSASVWTDAVFAFLPGILVAILLSLDARSETDDDDIAATEVPE